VKSQDLLDVRKFDALIRQLKRRYPVAAPDAADPIRELVLAFLQWEATRRLAELAYQRLMTMMVDHNDLRVSHSREVAAIIGQRYKRVEERTARLREALNEIYVREHAVTCEPLRDKPKKDIRTYLDTLPGIPQFVAARVALVCFGAHAVPLDQSLLDKLIQAGVTTPQAPLDQVAPALERHVKASEALETHLLLSAWSDDAKTDAPASAKPAPKPPAKPPTKPASKPTPKAPPKAKPKAAAKPAPKAAAKPVKKTPAKTPQNPAQPRRKK
jgi:endonuclease III